MKIRESIESDKPEISSIHIKVFGKEKGPEIVSLVNDLFDDKTAMPLLSLVAVEDDKIIGHILFTKANVMQTAEPVSARILAPLAVLPDAQRKDTGGQLVKEGLSQLKLLEVELVFVLGHSEYYPRFGFISAGAQGYEAPYHISEEHAGAWMVQELFPGTIKNVSGKIQCSDVFNQPEHWRE